MRIAVDGMGGDYAPTMVVEGVKLAMKHPEVHFVLFGDEGVLRSFFPSLPSSISIVHAFQKIGDDETGILAILRRPKSSLALAMKALAAKEVDAVVSAGDSRAIVAMAKHYVGLSGKVKRPVLGVFVPFPSEREVLLVDAGAYTGLHAVPLVQAALLGRVYWRVMKGSAEPRIALLNIGREKFKGPVEVRRAAMILQGLPVNFAGFVEPQDLFSPSTTVDILVANGFVGNLFLKLYESLAEHLLRSFETFCNSASQDFSRWQDRFARYRYEWTGGAPLLGIKRPVIVAHGRSGAFAISRAIEKAIFMAQENISAKMEAGIETDPALVNISRLYKSWAMSAFGRKTY
ncbi:MAG: hypothetical protein WHS38_08665 [Thermodesulforhabdaceae bacterium]